MAKKRTDAEQWEIDRPRIHALKGKILKSLAGYTEQNYRDTVLIISRGRTDSSKKLTPPERQRLIRQLSEQSGESYPHRPKNMDKCGSRADQLGKIEALLSIGKLPWSYADAIAKRMGLADKIQWVHESDLYKIITALRKRAQKEGWDLSGELK
jgi:phage gp16-like protein